MDYNWQVLHHAHDRLNLVSWGDANVSNTEDILVDDWRICLFSLGHGVNVGDLKLLINLDLTSLVHTLGHVTLHVNLWALEIVTPAVEDVCILFGDWCILSEWSPEVDRKSQFFQDWESFVVSSIQLWQENFTSLANSHLFAWMLLLDPGCSLNSSSTSSDTED